jgi:hypothetical protein
MDEDKNLQFAPKPITAVGVRPCGAKLKMAIGTMQRIAAILAYNSYENCKDWMEQLSTSYVVAITTRSADALLMGYIQNDLNRRHEFHCNNCKEASIDLGLIRERLFPELKSLREHANKLIHHLDDPNQKGISGLTIKGVYSYCYHLFHENIDALFGTIPNPEGKFPNKKCKKCKMA